MKGCNNDKERKHYKKGNLIKQSVLWKDEVGERQIHPTSSTEKNEVVWQQLLEVSLYTSIQVV